MAEAIPILEEAAQALNDLKRDDITEIRSFAKPHILVQKVSRATACKGCCRGTAPSPHKAAYLLLVLHDLVDVKLQLSCGSLQVCECVVILRNLKDVSWAGAKSMMADTNFLKSLVDFDKDGLNEKQVIEDLLMNRAYLVAPVLVPHKQCPFLHSWLNVATQEGNLMTSGRSWCMLESHKSQCICCRLFQLPYST